VSVLFRIFRITRKNSDTTCPLIFSNKLRALTNSKAVINQPKRFKNDSERNASRNDQVRKKALPTNEISTRFSKFVYKSPGDIR